jgi:hypothetical protein
MSERALFNDKRIHICPIGIPHEYACSTPRTCGRPDRTICMRCLLSLDPQRQEWIREYHQVWNDAVIAAGLLNKNEGTMAHTA